MSQHLVPSSVDRTKRYEKQWCLIVAIGILCLCLGLFVWQWRTMEEIAKLSSLHGEELAETIAVFEIIEGGLDAQTNPDRVLEVATIEYLPIFKIKNSELHCPKCDKFWITIDAQVNDVCVLEYSSRGLEQSGLITQADTLLEQKSVISEMTDYAQTTRLSSLATYSSSC